MCVSEEIGYILHHERDNKRSRQTLMGRKIMNVKTQKALADLVKAIGDEDASNGEPLFNLALVLAGVACCTTPDARDCVVANMRNFAAKMRAGDGDGDNACHRADVINNLANFIAPTEVDLIEMAALEAERAMSTVH
jgi:hypothetical protein